MLNYLGLNIPLILIESFGAALATVTREDWQAAFLDGGAGGLIGAALSPAKGFGKFCLVIVRHSDTLCVRTSVFSRTSDGT